VPDGGRIRPYANDRAATNRYIAEFSSVHKSCDGSVVHVNGPAQGLRGYDVGCYHLRSSDYSMVGNALSLGTASYNGRPMALDLFAVDEGPHSIVVEALTDAILQETVVPVEKPNSLATPGASKLGAGGQKTDLLASAQPKDPMATRSPIASASAGATGAQPVVAGSAEIVSGEFVDALRIADVVRNLDELLELVL